MKIGYSKQTGGFYLDCVSYKSLPDDLIEISEDDYQSALAISDGDTLDVVNGKLIIVPAKKTSNSEILIAAKNSAKNTVELYISGIRQSIAGTKDYIEVAAWSNKLRIASAIQSGTASDNEITAFQTEITLRGMGETLDDFCKKVFENATAYSMACSVLDGMKRSANNAVSAAKTSEEINSVVEQMKSEIAQKLGV